MFTLFGFFILVTLVLGLEDNKTDILFKEIVELEELIHL